MAQRLEHSDRAVNEARTKALQLRLQLELGSKLAAEGAALWAVAHAIGQLGGDSTSLMANLNAGRPPPARPTTSASSSTSSTSSPTATARRTPAPRSSTSRSPGSATGPASRGSGLEQGELHDLLASIEQSCETVEAMEAELTQRFEADQEQAKKVEIDLIRESQPPQRGRAAAQPLQHRRRPAQAGAVRQRLHQHQLRGHRAGHGAAAAGGAEGLAGAGRGPDRRRRWPGSAAAFAADRLDQRIRSFAELRRVLDYAVLGQIQQIPDDQAAAVGEFGLVAHAMARSPWAEAYRAVRTNIEFLRRNRRVEVVLVTSPYSGDGKSATASNLAISLAQAGRRVLLVDADLRKPSQQRIHGLSKERGPLGHPQRPAARWSGPCSGRPSRAST